MWLTETGGIVRFSSRYRGGTSRRARARRRPSSARSRSPARAAAIKRVYLYHWDADPKFVTWDSAFVAANGRARPALDVLRKELNQQRRARRLPRHPDAARSSRRRSKLPLA